MAEDSPSGRWSRRAILAAAGTGATGAVANALSNDDSTLFGGTMALDQAYNVSGQLWIGPDSAKDTVEAQDGRVFMAADTQVEYYGDGGSWVLMGVGSSEQPVPSVSTEHAATSRSWNPLRAETHHNRNHGDVPITGLFVGNNSPNATQNDATYNADTGEVTNGPGSVIAEYMDIRYRLQPVSNGYVELLDEQFSQRNIPDWSKARAVRFGAFANNWNERKYFVTGRAQFTDGSSSKRWIGFKVDGGALYAVMNDPDSSTYQEEQIKTFSNPTSQSHADLYVEYEPAKSEARFYTGVFEQGALSGATTESLTLETTFTSGFPSGALNSQAASMWHHMNKTYSSTTPETHINDVEVVMMPDGSF